MREVSRHKINGRFAPKKCTNYVTDEKWYCKIWDRFLVIKNYLSILAENGELILAEIAVAPLVGAWIETCYYYTTFHSDIVAPLVGAWIETRSWSGSYPSYCRSPRGSVD